MYAVRGRVFHLNVERVGNRALEGASGLAKECDREKGLRGKSGEGWGRRARRRGGIHSGRWKVK